MHRFICKRAANAATWLQICGPLFDSAPKAYNLPWGFARGLLNAPDDPNARFAYITDTTQNRIIQAILRSAAYAPTIFSKIAPYEENLDDEIASAAIDFMCNPEPESPEWELRDILGPSSFMKCFVDKYNAKTGLEEKKLHLWRAETWDECEKIDLELSKTFKSPASFELAPANELEELIRLREEFLKLVIPQLPPRAATEQWLKRQIDAKKLYILKDGQKIVSVASSDRESPDYESISMLYTPDEFRGHGYATQLIWTLTKQLLGQKKAVLLGIDSRNAISSHLYRKIGYKVIFEQGHYCIPSLLKSLEGK